MKKSGIRNALFIFLLSALFVFMSGFASANVIINEIMYNPNQSDDSDLEWVELFNNGTQTINLANWKINGKDFDDANITSGSYVVAARNLTDSDDNASFEAYYGNNDSIWNSTDASYKAVDGSFTLGNSAPTDLINLSNESYTQLVNYTDFLSLANGNGKTLIFYKRNWTESAIINGTPGATNDQFAPDFNKWANPKSNNSLVKGLLNITVNMTDATNVSSALINFNNTNYSMLQNNDLWSYLWNTSKNLDGKYNITLFFNDSLGFSNTDALFYITVDNTKPKIYNPQAAANSRNFVSQGFVFNASVNATDDNLLNVTCALGSATVANFSKSGDTHFCNLTAPSTESDFEITFVAADKANNTNTTTAAFTTKYSTSASLKATEINVSDLNQSNKVIEINATLSNKGSNPMYDTGVIIDSFSSSALSATSVTYQSCSLSINSSQSCEVTFNITVAGGTSSGSYKIYWDANWTDNNFTMLGIKSQGLTLPKSEVRVNSYPEITVNKSVSATVLSGESVILPILINSKGNADLQNVIITFSGNTLQNSYVTISPSSFASIPSKTNATFNAVIALPKYTSPGNYNGTIYVSASNASTKSILLEIEVPTNSSWTLFPSNLTVRKTASNAGLAATVYINNSGNIGQGYSIASAGTFKLYIWNNTNPPFVYVEKNSVGSVDIFNLADGPLTAYNLTLTITSINTSENKKAFITLIIDNANPSINITSPANNSFVKGRIDFNVPASDLNLSKIEFYINNNLVLNDINLIKTFKWNTTNGSYPDDIYTLKAIAYDGAGNSDSSEINVTVNNTDDSPLLKANIPVITILENSDSTTLDLSLYFKSVDGDSLRYNFTKPDNVAVNINNATQIADFIPAANFVGLNYIIFTAIDSSSNTTPSNNVTISITNVNDAPTAPLPTRPANNTNVSSSSGKAILAWSSSIDPDNDQITYYVFLSNNSGNASFNATTTATSLQLNNLDANKTYYWNVLASDGILNSSKSPTFRFLMAKDSNPVINSWVWNNTVNASSTETNLFVAENKTLSFKINAYDPDNSPVSFAWLIDNAERSNIQNFTFNLANNFTAAGNYALKLAVTDNNSNSVSQEWQVTVTNTDREPVLDAISDKVALEDSTLIFFITGSDPDEDNLTYESNISGMAITKISNTLATASWTPTNNDVGNNIVKFTVSDGSKTDSKTATITIINTNDAPIITDFFPKENNTIATNAGSQKFNVTFIDVDIGDNNTVAWLKNGTPFVNSSTSTSVPGVPGAPATPPITQLMEEQAPSQPAIPQPGGSSGGSSGSIGSIASITISELNVGVYNITAIVNDTAGAQARQEWKLTVTADISSDNLTSPVLKLNETERQSATNITINQTTFGGIDFGNNTLNFSGVALLEDAFNISKGIISVDTERFPNLNKSASLAIKWLNYKKTPLIYMSPGFEEIANGEACPDTICSGITYDAANGVLRFNVAHFTTFFTQANTTNGTPIITSTPITMAVERAKYAYDVDATDPDGDTLVYSLIISPIGMSINNNTGLISWTPSSSQLGLNDVAVSVSDGNLTGNQSFQISVGKGPMLLISNIDVKVDGKSSKNLQNNTKISKKAKPGSKVEFKLGIENLFTREEDLDIEDIVAEIVIEGIDDGDDIDNDAKEFNLRARKKEDVKISFDVPLEVEEDIFNVGIDVEGKDDNGTRHKIDYSLKLEVKKESHEIRIINSELSPKTIQCQRQISLKTEIINTGGKDEDDVSLEVVSPELGISSLIGGIELNEGTEDNRFVGLTTHPISPDVLPGTYPITINAYYNDKLSGTKTVELDVQECELTKQIKQEVKEKKPNVEVIKPAVIKEQKLAAPVKDSFKDSFAQTDEYKLLLAILIILFTGTAVFIIGAAFIILRK